MKLMRRRCGNTLRHRMTNENFSGMVREHQKRCESRDRVRSVDVIVMGDCSIERRDHNLL